MRAVVFRGDKLFNYQRDYANIGEGGGGSRESSCLLKFINIRIDRGEVVQKGGERGLGNSDSQ